MALIMTFNGQQVGEQLIAVEPASGLLTPPVFRAGLYQDFGGVNSESRNLLRGFVFHVYVIAADNMAVLPLIDAIQDLAGRVGDIEIMDGIVSKLLCTGWTIGAIPTVEMAEGFGGRLLRNLPIPAFGESAPLYPA